MAPILDPGVCQWGTSSFFIISDNVFANYIYYSHLFPALSALVLGLFVWLSAPKSFPNIALFLITLFFAAWSFCDLILWATEITPYTMFVWSILIYLDLLIYAGMVYFSYLFLDKKDISIGKKCILILSFVPLLFLAHTRYNLIGFDFSSCDREALEGPLWQYVYFVEVIFVIWIALLGLSRYKSSETKAGKNEIALFTFGTLLFLIAFAWGNIVGSISISWDLSQYGLFGMPIFIGFFAYLVTRYKSMGVRVIAAQVLVAASVLLVLSQLLVRAISNVRIITLFTASFIAIMGVMLVRSVKKEIAQRERIELLAVDLEQANKQQVALIHFITHQLKGFVAKSRNIFSMIQDGDFGTVPEEMKPMIREGFSSSTKGAQTIQDILNAANIKNGNISMVMAPFDFRELVEGIFTSLKPNADEKKIELSLAAPSEPIAMTGDRMQLENAIKNMIDNAIKYTPSGRVDIILEKDDQMKMVRFKTVDTGVGITPEDMKHLFTEGGRGAESQKVNVDSTGFGLYIVKNIIEAHHGLVWAESDGAGKGSTFVMELPVQ